MRKLSLLILILNLFYVSPLFSQGIRGLFKGKETSIEITKQEEETIRTSLQEDIKYLSSYTLEGRKAGEIGAQNAAFYLKQRLSELGYDTDHLLTNNTFNVIKNKGFGLGTRLVINKRFVAIPEDAIVMPFSSLNNFEDFFIKDSKEANSSWVIPLFNSEKEAKEHSGNLISYVYQKALEAIAYDASALFLYDEYDYLPSTINLSSSLATLDIPVIVLRKSVYAHHLVNLNTLSSVELTLEMREDYAETENIVTFLNNRADKTILLAADYDYLGYYLDSKAKYGHNKVIYHGADLNASGAAAVLALSYLLKEKSSVSNDYNFLFVFYSGSQLGNEGLKYFLSHISGIYLHQLVLAIHFDNIGKYNVHAGININEFSKNKTHNTYLNQLKNKLSINLTNQFSSNSHAYVYRDYSVSVLEFNTGFNNAHGTPNDIFTQINYNGLFSIVQYTFSILNNYKSYETNVYQEKFKEDLLISKTNVKIEEWGIDIDESYDGLGVKVLSLDKYGLGVKASMQVGDVIFNINGKPVVTLEDYLIQLDNINIGKEVKIKVKREVSVLDLHINL